MLWKAVDGSGALIEPASGAFKPAPPEPQSVTPASPIVKTGNTVCGESELLMSASDGENQVAWRAGRRHAARLVRVKPIDAVPDTEDYQLQTRSKGTLDALYLAPAELLGGLLRGDIGETEQEREVAVALDAPIRQRFGVHPLFAHARHQLFHHAVLVVRVEGDQRT